MENLKIGIIGGSFNPIHNAHISIALKMYETLDLERVIFVPAYQSPFKTRKDYSISDEHRIKMIELAISEYPFFEIETYEISKKDTSYSIDTIRFIKMKYPNSELYFLMGKDQSKSFDKWRDWQEILQNTTLCIANRDNESAIFPPIVQEYIQQEKIKIYELNNAEIDISSTKIRQKIGKKEDISAIISPKVYDFIQKNHLYK